MPKEIQKCPRLLSVKSGNVSFQPPDVEARQRALPHRRRRRHRGSRRSRSPDAGGSSPGQDLTVALKYRHKAIELIFSIN